METSLCNKVTTIIYYLSIMIFIIAFSFRDNPVGNWYQQFLPPINNMPISDIFFLDSLTGWAVTNNNMPNDTGYILKTTNGGDNWAIKFQERRDFSRIKFINALTGFTCGGTGSGTAYFYKSTNGGDNWSVQSTFGCAMWKDMSVLSNDTISLVDDDFLCGGVFRTTDGGQNWTLQQSFGSNNPNHIYMFNRNIGFINSAGLKKTTDGGATWSPIAGQNGFMDMYFVDSLTGWKANGDMKKTTDGGSNWVSQTLPYGGNIVITSMLKFSNVSRDTIWGVGGNLQYPNFQSRGLIYRTTNGGDNWFFQIPDTSINIYRYFHNKFVSRLSGWAYAPLTGVHTIAGGDPIFYTAIKQISNEVPKEYLLFQNFPNPFNPNTNFKFQISKSAYTEVKVFDITGKLITVLLNQKLAPGEYEISFDAKELPSGVYFYSLIVDGNLIDTKKMIFLK